MVKGEDRKRREIGEDPSSNFLRGSRERGGNGRIGLAPRTRKAWAKLKMRLRQVKEEVIVKTGEAAYETRRAKGVRRFQTQKVIRPDKLRKLIGHNVHGALFTALKEKEVAHRNLIDVPPPSPAPAFDLWPWAGLITSRHVSTSTDGSAEDQLQVKNTAENVG
jgi:hypothetical protein